MSVVHHRFVWVVFVWALAASWASGANPDLASPKKAATAFALALQKGDFATVRSVTTGQESDYKLMQSVATMTEAANKVQNALVSKFGEEGKKIGAGISTGDPQKIPQDIAASEERVSGDAALIIMKGSTEAAAIRLTRVDGDWKVDLAHYPAKETLAQQASSFEPMSKLFTQIAADISGGKYRSALEAGQDISQRTMTLQMAMRNTQRPATTPSR